MISLIETKHTNPTCMGYTRAKSTRHCMFFEQNIFLDISICLGLLYTVMFVQYTPHWKCTILRRNSILSALVQRKSPWAENRTGDLTLRQAGVLNN
jgi:hypothetical protein